MKHERVRLCTRARMDLHQNKYTECEAQYMTDPLCLHGYIIYLNTLLLTLFAVQRVTDRAEE